MRLLQLLSTDGEEMFLLSTDRTDNENFGEEIQECRRLAEMAIMEIITDEEEEEDVDSIFENYLSEKGFNREFVDEYTVYCD